MLEQLENISADSGTNCVFVSLDINKKNSLNETSAAENLFFNIYRSTTTSSCIIWVFVHSIWFVCGQYAASSSVPSATCFHWVDYYLLTLFTCFSRWIEAVKILVFYNLRFFFKVFLHFTHVSPWLSILHFVGLFYFVWNNVLPVLRTDDGR